MNVPRLTHMVPQYGRKELVKKPALPFGKSFPFLSLLAAFRVRFFCRRCTRRFVFARFDLSLFSPVCSLPDVVLD